MSAKGTAKRIKNKIRALLAKYTPSYPVSRSLLLRWYNKQIRGLNKQDNLLGFYRFGVGPIIWGRWKENESIAEGSKKNQAAIEAV